MFDELLKIVIEYFNINEDEIRGKRRYSKIVYIRDVLIYLARENLNLSFPVIATELGRDHTTIMYSYYKTKKLILVNYKAENDISILSEKLNSKKPKDYKEQQLIKKGRLKKLEKPKKKEIKSKDLPKKEKILSLKDLPKKKNIKKENFIRMQSIIKLWRNGKTLSKIGEKNNLSRERIRQLILKFLKIEQEDAIRSGIKIDIYELYEEEKRVRNKKLGKNNKNKKKEKKVKVKRWSVYYDKCKRCSTTVAKHRSNGFCVNCYYKSDIFKEAQKDSRLRNIEKWKKRQKEYIKEYNKRPEVVRRLKKRWDEKKFGGNRKLALQRDGYKCQFCGMSQEESYNIYNKDLHVIHLDQKDDNRLENLSSLCPKCFVKIMFLK